MKLVAVRIVSALLTFTLGVAAVQIASHHFYSTAVGSLKMGPDGYGGFTALKSYDGTRVFFAHARFPSHEAAAETFRSKLRDAVRVVEREPLYDRAGVNIVGERVVAILPPNEYVRSEWAAVMCLDGAQLIEISSPSLGHALALDKAYRLY